jgi:hypothetical protein
MYARLRVLVRPLFLGLLVPFSALCFCSIANCRSPGSSRPVPEWAAVSLEQVAEAERLGVAVAYEEPRARIRFVLVPRSGATRAFYLSITETTNAQYHCFRPSHLGAFRKEEQPADSVKHADVLAFAAWVSEGAGEAVYRLPTEAEWEFACRAGTTTVFSYGDELTKLQANYNSDGPVAPSGRYRTMAVGSYPANAWGLFDMHGNLREWCSGRSGRGHVALRGGSWRHPAAQARSDYRYESELASAFSDPDIGFRIARSVNPVGGR